MNIVETETPFIVEAKTCDYNNKKIFRIVL